MRKRVFGRQLKRNTKQRKALFKSLASSLVLRERIKTTEAKAKAVRGLIDKLTTSVKKGRKQSSLALYLTQPASEKLVQEVAPRFPNRKGGYTRIIRLGKRLSDNAQMVMLEWVEGPQPVESSTLRLRPAKSDLAGLRSGRELKVENLEEKREKDDKTDKSK